MKNKNYLVIFISLFFIVLFSCNNDDDSGVDYVPPHERSDEEVIAQEEIEEFLETHFYNYEEFENPLENFDYRIVFDTINEENASKTPLMEQVTFKMVTDLVDESVEYKMYYLNVRQGGGEKIGFTDNVTLSYEGRFFEGLTLFDSAIPPVPFDLAQSTQGFREALIEFNVSGNFIENGDGTIAFEDYGIGAVFVPSGLAYYNTPPTSDIPIYSQLLFTFYPVSFRKTDHDSDNILSDFEDLDNDGNLYNDDTDGDTFSNFNDPDDDGDGRLTEFEIEAKEYVLSPGDPDPELAENEEEMQRKTNEDTGVITVYTVVYTDANNDGVPDYLDENL